MAKAKIDMECRLRAQIEQEMKEEMESMQKREVIKHCLRCFLALIVFERN